MTHAALAMMMMATMMMSNTTTTHNTYTRAMTVTSLDNTQDVVACEDAVGYTWEFYGCEDWQVGDLVITVMDDNGTPETILDDMIIDATFSGYRVD